MLWWPPEAPLLRSLPLFIQRGQPKEPCPSVKSVEVIIIRSTFRCPSLAGNDMRGQLATVLEEPVAAEDGGGRGAWRRRRLRQLIRWKLSPLLFQRRSMDQDLRLLLSVLGCPLSPVAASPTSPPPVHELTKKPQHQVCSKAEYIIRQYRATTVCAKTGGAAAASRSIYASGKLKMSTVSNAARGPCREGCFVLWHMAPSMWLAELVVAGRKVTAGSDGAVAWRRTPWLGTHVAKGGARPLRRFLQGLDPLLVAATFSSGQFMGERDVGDEECFMLKMAAEYHALSSRSDDTADVIKHVMLGFFSQRSGLLVRLEDSQITRIQSVGDPPAYWETTACSHFGDYRPVDGVVVAHAGRSEVSLTRLGDGVRVSPEGMEMEETWVIDDVAFDVRGLSSDSFLLPEEIRGDRRSSVSSDG